MSDDMLDSRPQATALQKLTVKRVVAVIAVIALVYVIFVATGQKPMEPESKEEPVRVGQDMLMDDQFEKFNQQVAQTKEVAEVTQKSIAELERQQELQQREFDSKMAEFNKLFEMQQQINESRSEKEPPLSNDPTASNAVSRYPPPPIQNPALTPTPQLSETLAQPIQVGGTAFFEFAPQNKKKDSDPAQEQYYLPPSFFSAKLLTGIDAVTSKVGADEPKPIMFMVDAPAVLPNHIREDLRGCFVIGNAEGNLGTERIEVLVVNISCLSADGNAVIDQPVLGYVNDKDGKRDMAGNVVSKEGSKLAWLFSASIVGAAGSQTSLSGVEQSLTSLGTVNAFDPSRAVQRSLGESVQETASEYKNIVLDYIRQSAPVIEVGPLKDVTIVIQEGTWLEIKHRQKQTVGLPTS